MELTYALHDAVASLTDDAQDRWLTWAFEYEATAQELRDAIRAEKGETPDGGESGSGVGEETRIEFDIDEGGAFRLYEATLDLQTGEEDRLHVATMHLVATTSGQC